MAIHNRGFYDGEGKGVFGAFRCIDKLMSNNLIDAGSNILRLFEYPNCIFIFLFFFVVFFASESSRLTLIASEMAFNRSIEFITLPKKQVNDLDHQLKDSLVLRNDMDVALVEWYLIGEGTYCMSNTIDMSTFSQTAIMRGNCHFIPIHVSFTGHKMCDLEYPQIEKETYLQLSKIVLISFLFYFFICVHFFVYFFVFDFLIQMSIFASYHQL